MCLAIPARILDLNDDAATVLVGTLTQRCYMGLLPDAKVGDYVIIHAGYAISLVDEDEALKTLELFRELGAAIDD